jgi:SPP1 gp7 family putative phage head morphogenesis protein
MMTPQERRRAAQLGANARLWHALERIIEPRLARAFADIGWACSKVYEAHGRLGVEHALEPHRDRIAKILMPHYRRVFAIFGDRFFTSLKETGAIETKDTSGARRDEFEIRAGRFLTLIGVRKITDISERTRSIILRQIVAGEREGLGVAEIARLIREKTGGSIGKARAAMIARTETHGAANSATFEAANASGIQGAMEWMAHHTDRTRPTHRRADGQRRLEGNPFKVGGATLRYPGDPHGPAREVINCRCALGFVPGANAEAEGSRE